MRRTTHHDAYEVRPNPLGQSFWLVITMGFAVLMIVGKLGTAVDGATPRYDAADLIKLADDNPPQPASAATLNAEPPALIEAPRVARPGMVTPVADVPATEAPVTETPVAEEIPAGEQSLEERGRSALATISYPWEQLLPSWTIEFLPERSGLYGLTLVPERKIEIYVRDGQTEELLAHVIAHELGHAVDVSLNDGPDRRAWEDVRGIGGAPWWPGNGTTDFSTGAGDFAESFAAWQVGAQSFRSTLGDPPTQGQIQLLAHLAAD